MANGGREGVCARAAKLLGVRIESVEGRVHTDARLQALYSNIVEKSVAGQEFPTEASVLRRVAPPIALEHPTEIQLVDMISDAEHRLHINGLKNLGVSDELLKHLKGLDKLASSSGHFLALALEKTCRNYYVLQLNLTDLANKTHAQLMIPVGEKGHLDWESEPRAFHTRNCVEMVKVAGQAFELMLKAAEAMAKMMIADKSSDGPGSRKKKPAWEIKKALPPSAPPTFKEPMPD